MQHAFIKLVPKSKQQSVSVEDVKQLFQYYKKITSQTGIQVSYAYANFAFPYEILNTSDTTLELKSSHDRYSSIYVGIGTENEQTFIQLSLPSTATFGDKGKANEFCRFLAKKLEGELQLFNGRTMYFYKR
ncbi:hypothetical protein CON65_07015 [Bacillus pseudomycoides]|uniref:DUF1885 domain-containing protein n=1 Tax=Bacillus pseudomycoides TaxID=64104 RepID=A0AA91ZU08_9BACI|nr:MULTISPECIES: DUF1885 family protein [Bacillus]PEB54961.1 hypothetical protein COO03_03100 [Bacillus sp. AFS098217]PED83305.1 hypothetical protein CON65_07015 [Bacillus pseudomycoides]PEU15913.1 hypothetical protein CN524_06535 [Bacillus sp. AFS019443]PEU20601.1 hypothetical protein CN525_03880 [Bacillus sp. AFS014408]PFW60404.1 hypothetical protein COL20_21850 [Bacillus sp. AFS075034]